MLANVPAPLSDQTLEGLVALIWATNASGPFNDAALSIFGGHRFNLKTPLPPRTNILFERVPALGYSTLEQLISAHCYLPLLRPFVSGEDFARIIDSSLRLGPGKATKLTHLIGISRDAKYCERCAALDEEEYGFAYARRTHQFVGVTLCHLHEVPLQSVSETCVDKLARRGIILAPIETVLSEPNVRPMRTLGSYGWAKSFSKFVSAALRGSFVSANAAHRKAACAKRLADKFPKVRSASKSLMQEVLRLVGTDGLSELKLPLSDGRTANWPLMILEGSSYDRHPIATLVTLSALFDDVDDYHASVSRFQEWGACINVVPATGAPVKLGLTHSMIKDLLRMPSLNQVGERYGLEKRTVRDRLRSLPMLARRRRAALKRQRLRAARRDLRQFVQRSPQGTRSDFEKQYSASCRVLCGQDRAWYEKQLPSRGHFSGRPYVDDESAIDSIRTAVERLKRESPHLRVCLWHLEQILPKGMRTAVLEGRLKAAAVFFNSVSETYMQYRDRCVRRLDELLEFGEQRGAIDWCLHVLEVDSRLTGVMSKKLLSRLDAFEEDLRFMLTRPNKAEKLNDQSVRNGSRGGKWAGKSGLTPALLRETLDALEVHA